MHLTIRRNRQRCFCFQESIRHLHSFGDTHSLKTLGLQIHRGNRTRHKQASGIVARSLHSSLDSRAGRQPLAIIISRLFPPPRILRCRKKFTRPCHIIAQNRLMPRSIGFVFHAQPGSIRIDHSLNLRIPLQEKSGLIKTDLCNRLLFSIIPNHGRQHVFSPFQVRSQINRFKIPVIDIPTCRPKRDETSIQIKLVTVVSRHMNNKAGWDFTQFERLAHMVDAIHIGRFSWHGNPACFPASGKKFGIDVGLPVTFQTDLGAKRQTTKHKKKNQYTCLHSIHWY